MKKPEFSKLVLGTAIVTWLAGAIFGAFIVIEERTQLGELLTYIGAPAATAFGFYYWKAKAENVIKIPKQLEQEKMPKSMKERIIKLFAKFISGIETEDFNDENT